MELDLLWWLLATALVIGGLAGTILPAMPGVPMVFAGLLLAAWITDCEPVGTGTIAVLGMLTALAWLLDFLAAALGAKQLGASPRAFWGAMLGAIGGLFYGLPGIILGPFIGAVTAELSGGRGLSDAGRAGLGAWIGTALGAAAKLAIAFIMVGLFVIRQFVGGAA